MHELIGRVLDQRDLSRARELFAIPDREVVKDLEVITTKLIDIFNSKSYLTETGDQSVVEICLARITSAIRETDAIESCASNLVHLLDACVKHNLARLEGCDEDPPHAKLASDLLSCIFLHYNKKSVMSIAVPVAVNILQKRNRDLVRNTSSYLVLAGIHNSRLLSKYTSFILKSITEGNLSLLRILPQIYVDNPDPIHSDVQKITAFLDLCEPSEKTAILNLCSMIVNNRPELLADHLPRFQRSLFNTAHCGAVLQIYLTLANSGHALALSHQSQLLKKVGDTVGSYHLLNVCKIIISIGKLNEVYARDTVDYLIYQSRKTDTNWVNSLFKDIVPLLELYPEQLRLYLMDLERMEIFKNNNNNNSNNSAPSVVQSAINKLKDHCESIRSVPTNVDSSDQVTLITLMGDIPSSSNSLSKASSGSAISNQLSNHSMTMTTPLLPLHHHHRSSSNSNNNNSGGSGKDGTTGGQVTESGRHGNADNHSVTIANPNMLLGGNTGQSTSRHSRPTILSPSFMYQPPPSYEAHLFNDNNSMNINQSQSSSSSPFYYRYGFRSRSVSNLMSPLRSKSSNKAYRANRARQLEKIRCQLQMGSSDADNNDYRRNSLYVYPREGFEPTLLALDRTGHVPSQYRAAAASVFDSTSSRIVTTFNRNESISTKRTGSGGVLMTTTRLVDTDESDHTCSNQLNTTADITSLTNGGEYPSYPNSPKMVDAYTQSAHTLAAQPLRIHLVNRSHDILQQDTVKKGNDAVKQFCEKHLQKIKHFVSESSAKFPTPCKCVVEDTGHRNHLSIEFYCQVMGDFCLHKNKPFSFKTKYPAIWLHLMFLHLQARSSIALSSLCDSVNNLKICWELLPHSVTKFKTFTALVTSAFPTNKEQQIILKELQAAQYFDLFSQNPTRKKWCCFPCNNPEKVQHFLQHGTSPVIEGQLKEKKGRWKFFKRWRTRYFTLSGATLFCRASENFNKSEIDIRSIRSVKSLSAGRKGRRTIPKAFEIFIDNDNSYVFKARDRKNAEEWFQCLQIAVAQAQKEQLSKC